MYIRRCLLLYFYLFYIFNTWNKEMFVYKLSFCLNEAQFSSESVTSTEIKPQRY